ncbi:hypothetical protein HanXRQr2_Chr08g0337251 [Helianthus annuus]|uniref:Uncharacterized protein n=1 Tax=Helianthus annuus TaxID=4232 RepID=A0A9K3IE43_HELAN|nr:hypothetical protein HanXRQr2_Chr08g0337251 [Helianthus annuus]
MPSLLRTHYNLCILHKSDQSSFSWAFAFSNKKLSTLKNSQGTSGANLNDKAAS